MRRTRAGRGTRTARWGRDLVEFEAGYLTFAAWTALTERLLRVNHDD